MDGTFLDGPTKPRDPVRAFQLSDLAHRLPHAAADPSVLGPLVAVPDLPQPIAARRSTALLFHVACGASERDFRNSVQDCGCARMLPCRHPIPSGDRAPQPFVCVALLRPQRPRVNTFDRPRAGEREIGMPFPGEPILGNPRRMIPGSALAAKPAAFDCAGGQHHMDMRIFPSVGRRRSVDGEIGDHPLRNERLLHKFPHGFDPLLRPDFAGNGDIDLLSKPGVPAPFGSLHPVPQPGPVAHPVGRTAGCEYFRVDDIPLVAKVSRPVCALVPDPLTGTIGSVPDSA